MSKTSYLFVIGIFLFSFMTVQSLIPVFANSSTATIIGGAANGNIFGSVQLDELNFTATVPIRSNGDDGPVWLTVAYPTTLTWNDTWTHTGINIGANKLNYTNMWFEETFANFMSLNPGDGNNRPVFILVPSGAGTNSQIQIYSTSDVAVNFEVLTVGYDGTNYIIASSQGGGGTLRPIQVEMGGNAIITFGIANTMDFNSRVTNNVGAAGNDFGATNTLVATTMSGSSTYSVSNTGIISSVANGFLTIKSQRTVANTGLGIEFNTLNGADGATTRVGLSSGVNTAIWTWFDTNQQPQNNNTLSIGLDAVRWANIYSVVNTAKTQVTGLILEADIKPNPGETFEDGDVVCAKLGSEILFTKCSIKGDDMVLGAVHFLPKQGVIGTQEETRYREVPLTETILQNVTSADGSIITIQVEQTVTEIIQVSRDVTLANGQITQILFNETVTVTVNESYTVDVPVYGEVSSEPILVYSGPKIIKICGPVSRGDTLVAGDDGCAISTSEVSGTKNIAGINVPKRIIAEFRGFAKAWEDSTGDTVLAIIRYG